MDNKPLKNWNVSAFPLDNMKLVDTFAVTRFVPGNQINGPFILRTTFTIKDTPMDTYLNPQGWGKGVVYINGYNIGRYWPKTGPQVTLYIPGIYLRTGANQLIVLEYEYAPASMNMTFQGVPNLGRWQLRVN